MKSINPKKIRVIATVILVALFISCLMSSCTKEDGEISVKPEKVVIKMTLNNGLKSASTVNSVKDDGIADGDTVVIYEARNLNLVLSAETESGNAMEGKWDLSLVDAENETDSCRFADRLQTNSNNNLIAIKPTELGLYRAYFLDHNITKTTVYIKHMGMPGQVGDDWRHGYAFLLEKKLFFNLHNFGNAEKAYTVFLRFNSSDSFYSNSQDANRIDPWLEENFKAKLSWDGQDKHFKVRRCKYSPEYVSFTFFPSEFPPRNVSGFAEYFILFYSGEYDSCWWVFSSVIESNWKYGDSNVIAFGTF